jgi:hypothetical protein
MPDVQVDEVQVLGRVLQLLKELPDDSRERVIQTACAYFGLSQRPGPAAKQGKASATASAAVDPTAFSADRSLSPKAFLLEKQPQTDVERVACLAYFLTHYLNQPHFKTIDISLANTQAAQVKFSNPAFATSNALKMGYLAEAGKGNRQLSAAGERFVQALPDRDAARKAMAAARPRKIKSRRATSAEEDS